MANPCIHPWRGSGQRAQQRALAGVGQAHQPNVGQKLELQKQARDVTRLAALRSMGGRSVV